MLEIATKLRETTGNDPSGVQYKPGFLYEDAVRDSNLELLSNLDLAKFIMNWTRTLNPKPLIMEFGCGPGYLFHWMNGNVDYIGMDGNPDFLKSPYIAGHEDRFLMLDLEQPVRVERDGPVRADAAVTFEVLEHIQEDRVDTLLKSITAHLKPNGFVFCTASNKHRSTADVHVTVKPRSWWLDKFQAHALYEQPAEEMMDVHPFNWRPGSTHAFILRHGIPILKA